jgi:hypothetical protein
MAKGVIPSREAWSRVSRVVRHVEGIPRGSQGAVRKKIFPAGTSAFIRVRVTGNATGGGKYVGHVVNAPASIAVTGNLADSDLGTNQTDEIVIINAAEVGQSTHDLTAATVRQKTFLATFLCMTTEATPRRAYMINGFDIEDC